MYMCVCVCISRHINTSHRQIVFPIFAQRRSWQFAMPQRPPQSELELELEFELQSELELELESELLKSTYSGFVLVLYCNDLAVFRLCLRCG